MTTRKSKTRQASKQPATAKTQPDLDSIEGDEIRSWIRKTSLSNLPAIELKLIKLYDAAREKNTDTLKAIARDSRDMIKRLANVAIKTIEANDGRNAVEPSRQALEQAYTAWTPEYMSGWNLYLLNRRAKAGLIQQSEQREPIPHLELKFVLVRRIIRG